MAIAPQRLGIGIRRHFTSPDLHPYDEVEWERRDARITNFRDGSVAFEQRDVEVPSTWSVNATNILAQKYFRGTLGTPERESSLKQVVDRVVNTITAWGVKDGYFVDTAEAEAFSAELKHLIVHQKAAFNSPVWFNIGVRGVPQQASACQPYDALVSTPEGLIPIGRLVEEDAVGTKVFDANGLTRIVATKHNGCKRVLRFHTELGVTLDVTGDHLVWRCDDNAFVAALELRIGDRLAFHEVEFGNVDLIASELEIAQIEDLGEMDVYDIQTESGEYLSDNLRVHNCFILSVEDSMRSILNWYVEEGTIFKGGSGSGINLSKIRSSKEGLAGGGTASGPVSFMRGADASAGTIKSGGRTRRSAKMVILNADHPDVEDFIWCKALEERKARALQDAGFDMDLDGSDSHSIQYQNANNSVRVTDEFMQAVVDDAEWHLRAVTTGEVVKTMKARELFRQIAKAAWECADPGLQFDTTINRWHTAHTTGRINASNPCCFTGDTLVETDEGLIAIELLEKRSQAGDQLPKAVSLDLATGEVVQRQIVRAWLAGLSSEIVEVRTRSGLSLRCTPEHNFLTASNEWVPAARVGPGTELRALTQDFVADVVAVPLTTSAPVYDLEVEETHNFIVSDAAHGTASVIVKNSEYMHLDNSACNLASINLLKFLDDDDNFDVEGFKAAVEAVFTAQEILVGNADYPTESIAETSRRFRQLGLGYANLGALLMALGLPYDSDQGRTYSAAITALMTGHAYATSARTASRMGPFAGFTDNAEHMIGVLRIHRDEVAKIDEELVPTDLLSAAQEAWDTAVEQGERYGVRNSQASVTAPTGTIGLLMDCDTTGVEPDLALVKTKKLVGGGTMSIVNQTVPRALWRLGYDDQQVEEIVAYIDEHKTIVGAPHLGDEHLPVFACSMGDNVIHYMGHLRMMGAVQPFLSGAQSKTVNTPENTTVEEIEQLHIEAWRLGIKAIAIYRDNCKVGQPLSTTKKASTASPTDDADLAQLRQSLESQVVVVKQPLRERMPRKRRANTFKFRVADCEGYVTVGEYDDGRPGEIFVRVAKQGSVLAGIMDAFAVSISVGLQHGVPLATYVKQYANTRFEPAGITDDPQLRIATSIVDYIFRRLGVDYLPREEREEMGILTSEERTQPTLPGIEEMTTPSAALADAGPSAPALTTAAAAASDAPYCYQCGVQMQRAGSCHACPSCGTTSGCS